MERGPAAAPSEILLSHEPGDKAPPFLDWDPGSDLAKFLIRSPQRFRNNPLLCLFIQILEANCFSRALFEETGIYPCTLYV